MKRVFWVLVAMAAPMLAQEPSPVRIGMHLEYGFPGGASTKDDITGANDTGSQKGQLYGLGIDFPVYFGMLFGERYFPIKAWPGVIYREGAEKDSLTAPSLTTSLSQGGTTTLYGVKAERETKITEITLKMPFRWYFGWNRQYTEGPYVEVGPIYTHYKKRVGLKINGSSSGSSVTLDNNGSLVQKRIGWMLGTGVSWRWYETRLHFGADVRRVNNPTIQPKTSINAVLGIHY